MKISHDPGLKLDSDYFSKPKPYAAKMDIIVKELLEVEELSGKEPSFGLLVIGDNQKFGNLIGKSFYPILGLKVVTELSLMNGLAAVMVAMGKIDIEIDIVIVYTSVKYYYRLMKKYSDYFFHKMRVALKFGSNPKLPISTKKRRDNGFDMIFRYPDNSIRVFITLYETNMTRDQVDSLLDKESKMWQKYIAVPREQ